MTEQELKSKLDAAERNPEELARAVVGLPDHLLRRKPAPDKWSIIEIMAHLADIEMVYGYRLRQMLADNEPVIAPIDQDAWANKLGYMEHSAPELIAAYALTRRMNMRLLRRISVADLEKGAFHPEMGRKLTVAELVDRMAAHGRSHLEQIEKLKKM